MAEKFKSIKATQKTIDNLNLAAALSKKKQYQVGEEASEDVLTKISKKIKQKK